MDITRLQKDINILISLKRQGVIRDVDWSIGSADEWITIFGAFPLPAGEFSYPDVNLKLPIPADLYEPSSRNKFHYYGTIFVDRRLRRKVGRKWAPIARQYPGENRKEARRGWSFLCIFPRDVREGTDIRAILPIVQRFILANGNDRG